MVRNALWGDHLWNSGRWLANHLEANPDLVKGKTVVELGAGASLPSLIASKLGAQIVTCTDYPDRELIDNLAYNFESQLPGSQNSCDWIFVGRWYFWTLKNFQWSVRCFFFAICCLITPEHTQIAWSSLNLIHPHQLLSVSSHYRPWLAEKDLEFLFRDEWAAASWIWEKKKKKRGKIDVWSWSQGCRSKKNCPAYQLKRIS